VAIARKGKGRSRKTVVREPHHRTPHDAAYSIAVDDDRSVVLPFPQAPEAIELRHLRAFVAVAEELSFSRAAERLYLSQPALSRQISALERLLGCELLNRSTHGVEPTLAGDALLDKARAVLRDVDAAVQRAQSVGGELVGRVTRLWEPMVDLFESDASIDEMRAAFEEMQGKFSPPRGTSVRPVNAGGVQSLLVSPSGAEAPTLLFLHGGGYVLGSAFGYAHLAGALAGAAGTGVLVPDYRLAPEHPFPAALDDAVQAYEWLLARGEPVAVAGDSAGAGLTLSLLIALKDRGLPQPHAAALMCPAVDLSWTVAAGDATDVAEAASERLRERFTFPYLAGHPLDDPVVSPLSADLRGLPPMLVQAATGDTLLAHAHRLSEHARGCGVDVHLELYPTATHGFQFFWSFLPEAADAVQRAARFCAGDTAVASVHEAR
jgi:monoterpene epsilon-lactone hydrolase